MSEETKQTSTEVNGSEENLEQSTSVEAEAQTEASEEKAAERPGVCCGSCS